MPKLAVKTISGRDIDKGENYASLKCFYFQMLSLVQTENCNHEANVSADLYILKKTYFHLLKNKLVELGGMDIVAIDPLQTTDVIAPEKAKNS